MIRILDRYILRQIAGIFLFGVALFTVMLAANHLFFLARFALQQHVSVPLVARLLLLRLPYFGVFSFPMALLLGALLTVGRLSDHNEIVAMRTGGISLARVALPVLAAGALVAGAGIALGEYVVPLADEHYFEEFRRAVGQPVNPQSYVLFREVEGSRESVIYARRVSADGGTLEDVLVNEVQAGRLARIIQAARARYQDGQWIFADGVVHQFEGAQRIEVAFQRLTVGLRRTPGEILVGRKDPADMTIRELRAYIGVLRRAGESITRYLVWLHSRVALPLSSVTFALLAVSLGLRPHRSSSSIGLGLTVLIIIVYYLLVSSALALGENDRLHPILAAWSPNVIVLAMGAYLLWRAR